MSVDRLHDSLFDYILCSVKFFFIFDSIERAKVHLSERAFAHGGAFHEAMFAATSFHFRHSFPSCC